MARRSLVAASVVIGAALGAFFPACSSSDNGSPTNPEAGLDDATDALADGDAAGPSDTVEILSISDWHAQIDPLQAADDQGVTQAYGGLAVLSTYFKTERAMNPKLLLLTSGDSYGATPPLSALANDVPAIVGMNFLKFTADTEGNHNFDHGTAYMKPLSDLATFPIVLTNADHIDVLGPNVKPHTIVDYGPGIKVGILGLMSLDAPANSLPGVFDPVTLREPVQAANQAAMDVRAAGANVVVALAHMGATGKDAAGNPSGPLIEFAKGLEGVDVVLGDHTDTLVNTRVNRTLVVENRSKGRTFARIKIPVQNGATTPGATAEFVDPVGVYTAKLACDAATCTCPDTPCPDATYQCTTAGQCQKNVVDPDPDVDALVAPYRTQLSAAYDGVIATIDQTMAVDRKAERVQEVALGDLVADAMLDYYKPNGAQIAFYGAGTLRAPLPSTYAPTSTALRRPAAPYAPGPPFDLVVGDIYVVLPFLNNCVVRQISGQTIWKVLENSVFIVPATNGGRFLQIAGFSFTYQLSNAPGARVVSVTLDDGTTIPIDDPTMYTIVDIDFDDQGGDGYSMLVQPAPAPVRDIQGDILVSYLKKLTAAGTTITTPTAGRITQLP
jgi:5'-nucleotidase